MERLSFLDTDPNVGPNAKYGFVFDYALPKLVEFKVDLRSFNKLDTSGTGNTHIAKGDLDENTKNAFGLRAKAILLAGRQLHPRRRQRNTAFGGRTQSKDMGFGGKLGYKYMLDDKMYVKPNAGINFVIDNAAASGVAKGTEDSSYVAKAGVLLGWGEKSEAIDTYFFDDSDQDWGYYPGLSAGLSLKSKNFNGATNDAMMGMNVSFLSGDLIPNLTAAVAFEVADLQADDMVMGFSAVAKYAVAMDPMTVTPKFGINYYSIRSQPYRLKQKLTSTLRLVLKLPRSSPTVPSPSNMLLTTSMVALETWQMMQILLVCSTPSSRLPSNLEST
ncbi:hypothetical protein MASR2M78_07120 [Treponema sp.]